jgi:hypothetical protein
LDGKQPGKFKRHQAHSSQQLSTHAATDDRYANFSASTCPTQPPQLTASSTADKLPLEKFHRLLDLVFWGKFLKFGSISCFVFLWVVNRVSPGITGYHSTRFFLGGLRRSELARPGGGAKLSCSPGPRSTIAFFCCLYAILPVYGNG